MPGPVASWPGADRDEHVDHGGAFRGVQRLVRAATPPAGADCLPAEPRRRGREHRQPGGAGDRAEPGLEHAGHRGAHQGVHPIDVAFGAPAPQAGDGQAARAVDGDRDHERREAAREPARAAHASLTMVACVRVSCLWAAAGRHGTVARGRRMAVRAPRSGDSGLRIALKG
jgi:hypothetical protein